MLDLNFFDATVMGFVQDCFHNPVTDAVFPVITYLGEAGVFWLTLSVVMLFFRKTRRCGVLAICAVALGFLIGEVAVKNIVCRPRPFVAYPDAYPLLISPPSGFSFPSGHTCSSFAAATVIFAHFRKFGWAAYVLAALIAFSRIFLFVHYPTDVLVGVLLGTACALAVLWTARRIADRRADPRRVAEKKE